MSREHIVTSYEEELRQLELSVIQEVSEAFLFLNEAAETISTAEVALVNAEENMALATGRYDNEFRDLARVIRGEKKLQWDSAHDLAVH